MTASEPIEVTLAVTGVLLHGIPRATLDVDIVADLRMAHLDPFVAALSASFYVDPDMVREAIRRRATFNILHLATMFKVDVFVTGSDELLSIELSRKRRVRVLEEPQADLFVASPEDMVLQKLIWYREGGGVSDRQWGDVIGVIKTQGSRLDLVYLHLWAGRKGLADLLERALSET